MDTLFQIFASRNKVDLVNFPRVHFFLNLFLYNGVAASGNFEQENFNIGSNNEPQIPCRRIERPIAYTPAVGLRTISQHFKWISKALRPVNGSTGYVMRNIRRKLDFVADDSSEQLHGCKLEYSVVCVAWPQYNLNTFNMPLIGDF